MSALGDIAQSHIRGKAVLDVGCGSGVLAMACARLGARAVYAVEASEMAMYARQIVKDNGLDSIVKVHHCSAEEVALSPAAASKRLPNWKEHMRSSSMS